MKTRLYIFLFACLLEAATECYSQDSAAHQTWSPIGIGVQAGVGYFAVRDDHISKEKYAGSSSWIALQWSKFHETYGFRISMIYQRASELKNFNVSSEVTMGGFDVVNVYPTGPVTLFGTDIFTHLGPSAEIFVYDRRQNIAQNTYITPNIYESIAWMFSMGGRAELMAVLSNSFQAEGTLQMSLLSFGGGTGDNANSSTGIRLITALAGLHATAEIGLRYEPLASISFAAGYRFDLVRIKSWNYVLASSDNVFVSLVYHF